MKMARKELDTLVNERSQEAIRHVRGDALSFALRYLHDRHELDAKTPEDVTAVAAKFEAYLTAPPTVFTRHQWTHGRQFRGTTFDDIAGKE